MKIEKDEADVLTGMRGGETLGSPIVMAVWNRDFKNWTDAMDPFKKPKGARAKKIIQPRPGHADMVGALKYNRDDCRDILERASARETAGRVAAGSLCRVLLREFGVELVAHVVQIGSIHADTDNIPSEDIAKMAMKSDVRCCDKDAAERMHSAITRAKHDRDSLGGVVETRAWGLPLGLGSHTQWDRKLDARIAQMMQSIQAVKGVEVGIGFRGVGRRGSNFHDEIVFSKKAKVGSHYVHETNRAGGTEGGMSTGEEVVVRVAKKPIATLMRPLSTVILDTHEPAQAVLERSDTCAVPALAVIVEATLAIVLAEFFIEKFGGDNLEEMKRNYTAYIRAIAKR
jgi:chorismate synthase